MIKQTYQDIGERAIASYDFIDIALQQGVKTFYGGKANGTYFLTTTQFYSDAITTAATISNTNYVLGADVDFDIEFNAPQNVKGQCIVNVPMGMREPNVATNTHDILSHANIKKWDGTTETFVLSGSSLVTTAALTGGQKKYAIGTIILDLPLTHFKKGESLRLTIEQFAKNNGPNDGVYFIGHDPKDRGDLPISATDNFGTEHSQLSINVPFRIDL